MTIRNKLEEMGKAFSGREYLPEPDHIYIKHLLAEIRTAIMEKMPKKTNRIFDFSLGYDKAIDETNKALEELLK